ncbi:MAG: energy transducer TonB, partial [Bacteroidetes bacterium]
MSFLETKDKQKSAALTTVIAVLIVFLIFNFGMTYFDPPKEYGIAVNFGTNDFGSGNVQPKEALKPAKQEIVEEEQVEEQIEEEVVEEQLEESAPVQNDAVEDVITQNNEDAIAIKKKEEAKKKKEADRIIEEKKRVEKERLAEVERKKAEEKKRAEEERKAKEAKRKGVNNIINKYNNNDGKADGGEGDDNKAGDKGKVTGDPNASGYYGAGGSGSGGNYRLGNRKAKFQPDPIDDCVNEFGVVVVKIQVDQKGNVIKTSGPARGTKNSSPCLLSRAKEAALKTKFNPSS